MKPFRRFGTLNTPIPYEALSYTWGSPDDDDAVIRVESTENVPVQRNLEESVARFATSGHIANDLDRRTVHQSSRLP
jgi:hypothetical protein